MHVLNSETLLSILMSTWPYGGPRKLQRVSGGLLMTVLIIKSEIRTKWCSWILIDLKIEAWLPRFWLNHDAAAERANNKCTDRDRNVAGPSTQQLDTLGDWSTYDIILFIAYTWSTYSSSAPIRWRKLSSVLSKLSSSHWMNVRPCRNTTREDRRTAEAMNC